MSNFDLVPDRERHAQPAGGGPGKGPGEGRRVLVGLFVLKNAILLCFVFKTIYTGTSGVLQVKHEPKEAQIQVFEIVSDLVFFSLSKARRR